MNGFFRENSEGHPEKKQQEMQQPSNKESEIKETEKQPPSVKNFKNADDSLQELKNLYDKLSNSDFKDMKITSGNQELAELEQKRKADVNKQNEKISETENVERYSTYEERINHTPKNHGKWSGVRGESKFTLDKSYKPDVAAYLESKNMDGIFYKNGEPDFLNLARGIVSIENMTETREGENGNFAQADRAEAARRGCSPRDVANWRRNNGFTWHECGDMRTCQKVPTNIHQSFSHLGGVAECKRRDNVGQNNSIGGRFDE